ncbi:tetratricopeptide repeat protein [Anabaena cylindrica UHCC 0172]|uniref:tetratricopeptide repeat protein n=1 Tax=Anabaena cylindrica TaxID=1165 RepID=UPI002B207C01|nr:tetratricopeptide repeat protein [Anabaena cylindrica]MEA5549460.1 tetratricopeptide repeat protein [Anabaena cylindrica UHCC 0172]
MQTTFVSHFTPSLMSPEALEAILVQRHQLADELEAGIRESVLTEKKHFYLLVGTRGIGKTHMVSLTYHRIVKMEDLRDKVRIAWLREEEWGVTTFLDLLLRIFRALQNEYPVEYDAQLNQQVEELYQLSAQEAETVAAELLREFVGKRTLLLLTENLDDLFDGLGEIGQKKFREYIQKNSFFTILATAQSLFTGVLEKNSPFYEFFQIHHLEELTLEEAIDLLRNIARQEGKSDLENFILTSTGRDRIHAVHHLAAGNPRVYVIFSQLITRESLDQLVEPFMRMLDDLTPYYQSRISWLSQQQRKIVELLTERRHAVSVKEIAQRCFITHQTASSQLKDLREKGYVKSENIGRESFYELREPLMRFCLEMKKQRGEPIRLFVDFLRIWYTKEELKQRLNLLPPEARQERDYIIYALRTLEQKDEDFGVSKYVKDLLNFLNHKDYINALEMAEKLVEIRGGFADYLFLAATFLQIEHYEQALLNLDKSIELDPNYKEIWFFRGYVMDKIEQYDEAINSYNMAIEIDSNYIDALFFRVVTFYKNELYDKALESFQKVIKLEVNDVAHWLLYGSTLYDIERYEESLFAFSKANELQPNDEVTLEYICLVLFKLERDQETLKVCDQLIELNPNESINWFNKSAILSNIGQYNEALISWNKAIELNPNDPEIWYNRGKTLTILNHYEEALESVNKAIELDPKYLDAWLEKTLVLYDLKRYEESLASSHKMMSLGYQSPNIIFNVADCLLALNRWEEGIKVLDNILNEVGNEENQNLEDTELIIYNLFNKNNDISVWKNRIQTLIKLYNKYQLTSALVKAFIDNIPDFISTIVSDKTMQTWLEVWRELVGSRPEFQTPLRLLDAAVRYRLTKGDRRVLLELPIEERQLLQQVLELEES